MHIVHIVHFVLILQWVHIVHMLNIFHVVHIVHIVPIVHIVHIVHIVDIVHIVQRISPMYILTDLISDWVVYRTALATPGVLIMIGEDGRLNFPYQCKGLWQLKEVRSHTLVNLKEYLCLDIHTFSKTMMERNKFFELITF